MAIGIGVSQVFGGIPPNLIGGGGSGSPPPAVPTLTAPAGGATVFNGVAATLGATTTDTDLNQMSWVINPSGSNTVVATTAGVGTPAGTFAGSWTNTTLVDGSYTLVARATRGAQSTDSAPISITLLTDFTRIVTAQGATALLGLQSDLGITIGTGVSQWNDQSAGGFNMTQVTGAKQPTNPAAVLNGYGTVLYTAAGAQVLQNATGPNLPAPGTTATTVYNVMRLSAWVVNKTIYASKTSVSCALQTRGVTPQIGGANGANGPLINSVIGTWNRVIDMYNNSTTDYTKVAATNSTGTNKGNTDPTAGWDHGGSAAAAQFSSTEWALHLVIQGAFADNSALIVALDTAVALKYGGLVAL
jgi:hypothetical protein